MNLIALSDLRKLEGKEIDALLPVGVTYNGKLRYILDKPENVISLTELHPRVRTQLRAQEARARAGMPASVKVFADDIIEERTVIAS